MCWLPLAVFLRIMFSQFCCCHLFVSNYELKSKENQSHTNVGSVFNFLNQWILCLEKECNHFQLCLCFESLAPGCWCQEQTLADKTELPDEPCHITQPCFSWRSSRKSLCFCSQGLIQVTKEQWLLRSSRERIKLPS